MLKKPNVLLIMADQHRQDCLSVYGNPDVATPNIESLARDGIVYGSHFCPYPICTPSRYSLLTGQYPHAHLGMSNFCTPPGGLETFPRVLRREGWKTAAVGKMHFAPTFLDIGFDTMSLAEQDGPGRFDDDYHKYLKRFDLIDAIDLYDQREEYRKNAPPEYWETFGAMPSDLPEKHHSTTWITDRALDVIDGWDGGGNLLMVGYIKPHHPFDPPGRYAAMYEKNALSILPGYTAEIPDIDKQEYYFDYSSLTEDAVRRVMAMYYGTITHIDDSVGRIIALLRQKELYDDTMIIYTSDHGEYLGFHHLLLKGGAMYDPLVKIPLIVKYPDGDGRHGQESSLTSTLDIPAMILGECGAEIPKTMRPNDRKNHVFAEFLIGRNQYMIRSHTHKLLINGSFDHIRLYDLHKDPWEMKDVSRLSENQAIVDDLKGRLIREFLFAPMYAHVDLDAPVVHACQGETPDEMMRYMRERSPVKPADHY